MSIAFANDATLTVRQLAKRWGCHVESIRRRLRSGELKSLRLGIRHRFKLSEIQRVEKKMAQKQMPPASQGTVKERMAAKQQRLAAQAGSAAKVVAQPKAVTV
jgi:excisionase family DNA binding protein